MGLGFDSFWEALADAAKGVGETALDVGGRVLSAPAAVLVSAAESAGDAVSTLAGASQGRPGGVRNPIPRAVERVTSPDSRFGYSPAAELMPNASFWDAILFDSVSDPTNLMGGMPFIPARAATTAAKGAAKTAAKTVVKELPEKAAAAPVHVFDEPIAKVEATLRRMDTESVPTTAGKPPHSTKMVVDDEVIEGRTFNPLDDEPIDTYLNKPWRSDQPYTFAEIVEKSAKSAGHPNPKLFTDVLHTNFWAPVAKYGDLWHVFPNKPIASQTSLRADRFGGSIPIRPHRSASENAAISDTVETALKVTNDPLTKRHYESLRSYIHNRAKVLEDLGIEIKPTRDNPYDDYDHLYEEFTKNPRQLFVYNTEIGFHPLLSAHENNLLRGIHDITHVVNDQSFSEAGEYAAALAHAYHMPVDAWPAAAMELSYQDAVLRHTGEFMPQPGNVLPLADQQTRLSTIGNWYDAWRPNPNVGFQAGYPEVPNISPHFKRSSPLPDAADGVLPEVNHNYELHRLPFSGVDRAARGAGSSGSWSYGPAQSNLEGPSLLEYLSTNNRFGETILSLAELTGDDLMIPPRSSINWRQVSMPRRLEHHSGNRALDLYDPTGIRRDQLAEGLTRTERMRDADAIAEDRESALLDYVLRVMRGETGE